MYMVRQKVVEQERRAQERNKHGKEPQRHDIDEEITFSWSEVSGDKKEKAVFASLYGWMAAVVVQYIRDFLVPKHGITNFPMDIYSYICCFSIAVSEKAINANCSEVTAIRADKLDAFSDMKPYERPYLAVIRSCEQTCKTSLKWTFDNSFAWMIECHGILRRSPTHDSRHAEYKTRIPYMIARDQRFAGATLVSSCDSDCPTISLANEKL